MTIFFMFADDTAIVSSSSNLVTAINSIQNDLNLIQEWLNCNKLELNISKCSYIIFHSHQKSKTNNHCLRLNHNIIQQREEIQYLRIIIDSHLSWKPLINHTTNAVAKYIDIFAKIRHFVSTNILRLLYHTLFLFK